MYGVVEIKRDRVHPLWQAVKRAFPGYRKHRITASISKSVTPYNWWWDGGSRNEYWIVENGAHAHYWTPPAYPRITAPDILTQPGRMVVEGGHFCGKAATLHLHIHPDDGFASLVAGVSAAENTGD